MKQTVFYIENLGCANCAAKMEEQFNKLPQVEEALVVFEPEYRDENALRGFRFCRQHNHRKIIGFPKPHGHGDSIHPRHHNIYNGKMNFVFSH